VAFAESLAVQRAFLDGESSDVLSASARNLLVYHGVGGIGKTTLSRRLQDWVNGNLPAAGDWGVPPVIPVAATVRIDLHGSQGNFNVAAAVVALRRALADVKPRWPAFDWAFATWWAAAHPDEALPGSGQDRDKGFTAAIVETVSNVLADLGVLETAIGIGFRAARLAARKFIEARDRHFAAEVVGDEEWFRDLLRRCADVPSSTDPHPELLAEVAELLALELDHVEPCPLVVVFVDTYERVQVKQDHARTGEAMFNRLVWNLPQMLFVVTGRNRLNWGDLNDDGHGIKRTNLEHAGPATWPGLVPGATCEPRHHLVGDLSADDTRALILRTREAHDLPISDEVVEALVRESNGLPQYLDLAREVALKIKRNGGEEVTMADVTGSLGDLVERVMDDIPDDEQKAIRAAALFLVFDDELIAAAGGVEVGCARRAVTRPMVEKWTDRPLPYRMHETVRAAIRNASSAVTGGWAEPDWSASAVRALAELHRRVDESAKERRYVDQLRAIGMAVTLVCAENAIASALEDAFAADWLCDAVVFGPSIEGLSALVPPVSRTEYGQGFLDFIVAKSLHVDADTEISMLGKLSRAGHPMSVRAMNHLAYALRRRGQYEAAITAMSQAVAVQPSPLNIYQRRFTMLQGRRFSDAIDGDEELDDERSKRLHAWVAYCHGIPDEIVELHRRAMSSRRLAGKLRDANEEWAGYTFKRSFFFGDIDASEVSALITHCDNIGYHYGLRLGLSTSFVIAPYGSGLQTTAFPMRPGGLSASGLQPYEQVGRLCQAWANDDGRTLSEIAMRLQVTNHSGFQWLPVESLLNHLGYPVEYPPAQWLEPFEEVQQRWIQHWCNWYDRVVVGTASGHA
jgi:hypothetical protein